LNVVYWPSPRRLAETTTPCVASAYNTNRKLPMNSKPPNARTGTAMTTMAQKRL
jgi:hypothetical protein